ncbi:hypothetical protein X975_27167, partial [Stegodyphus mimosarum]
RNFSKCVLKVVKRDYVRNSSLKTEINIFKGGQTTFEKTTR